MSYGEKIICPYCNTVSIPPYYSCKKDCPLTISGKEWEIIRKDFESRPIACLEKRTKTCQGRLILPEDFIRHVKEEHKINRIYCRQSNDPKSLGVVYISCPGEKIGSAPYFRWPAIYFEADDKIFIVNIVYDHGQVFWWVIGNFCETKPNKYIAECSLKLNYSNCSALPNPALLMTGYTRNQKMPIRCLQLYDFDMVKKLEQATSIAGNLLLENFCKPQHNKQQQNCFQIKIRVSKISKSTMQKPTEQKKLD